MDSRFARDACRSNGNNGRWHGAYVNRTIIQGAAHPTEFQHAGSWGYQSGYSDATDPDLGLQYLQERYYEPEAGRFVSQ